MKVPFVDLAARHQRVAAGVEANVLRVLRSGRYVGGPEVAEIEAAVAQRLGRAHGVGVASGTDALVLALQALGVGPGADVVIPAVSFFATAGAVCRTGARPVVVDVLPDRPLMDPDLARKAVGPRTWAVVPVHLFGNRCPHPAVVVPVVDDAAQAVGTQAPVGQGAAAAVSFYPTKVLGAAGEGGLVATDHPDLAQRVRQLGNHGAQAPHLHVRHGSAVGTNSRLPTLQAAVLLAHLEDLDARVSRRRQIAWRYSFDLDELLVPFDPDSAMSVCVLRHPERDRLAAALAERGVGTAVYYPRSLAAQPALGDQAPTPHADRFCAQALALPCHAGMDEAAVDHVIAAVRALA